MLWCVTCPKFQNTYYICSLVLIFVILIDWNNIKHAYNTHVHLTRMITVKWFFEMELSAVTCILIFNTRRNRFNFLCGEKTSWEKANRLHGNSYHKKTSYSAFVLVLLLEKYPGVFKRKMLTISRDVIFFSLKFNDLLYWWIFVPFTDQTVVVNFFCY